MNYLGLNEQKIGKVAEKLNLLLANYHIYYQNLRNFHWNISGPHFFDLHAKFEEMYNDASMKIDAVAERILSIHANPVSTLEEYLNMAELKEEGYDLKDREMVEALLQNHKKLIANFRDIMNVAGEAEDESTIDLIGGYLADMEKSSWMLSAWLSKKYAETTNEQRPEYSSVSH